MSRHWPSTDRGPLVQIHPVQWHPHFGDMAQVIRQSSEQVQLLKDSIGFNLFRTYTIHMPVDIGAST